MLFFGTDNLPGICFANKGSESIIQCTQTQILKNISIVILSYNNYMFLKRNSYCYKVSVYSGKRLVGWGGGE